YGGSVRDAVHTRSLSVLRSRLRDPKCIDAITTRRRDAEDRIRTPWRSIHPPGDSVLRRVSAWPAGNRWRLQDPAGRVRHPAKNRPRAVRDGLLPRPTSGVLL